MSFQFQPLDKNMIKTEVFHGTDGNEYRIKGNNNCKTQSVIYSLFCKKCDKTIYVGQTGRTLYERMMVNLSNIRNNKNDAVSEHFNRDDHVLDDYQLVATEKTYGDEISRLTKESL